MRIKLRIVVAVLSMIILIWVTACGVIRYADKDLSETLPSHQIVAKAKSVEKTEATIGTSTGLTSPEIKREQNAPLTKEEIDLIALVTMGEAEGETELGKRLVIDTILNRIDHPAFPDTVYDVVYQPNQFSVMWDGRIERCYVMPEIVGLVKEELSERTNYDCVFFMAGEYSIYGKPMFQECCHYFSSYD